MSDLPLADHPDRSGPDDRMPWTPPALIVLDAADETRGGPVFGLESVTYGGTPGSVS